MYTVFGGCRDMNITKLLSIRYLESSKCSPPMNTTHQVEIISSKHTIVMLTAWFICTWWVMIKCKTSTSEQSEVQEALNCSTVVDVWSIVYTLVMTSTLVSWKVDSEEHEGDMEEIDASHTHYQYGSRELQLFHSDSYTGECTYS